MWAEAQLHLTPDPSCHVRKEGSAVQTMAQHSLAWSRPFMRQLVGGAKGREGGEGSGDSEQASVSQGNVIIALFFTY